MGAGPQLITSIQACALRHRPEFSSDQKDRDMFNDAQRPDAPERYARQRSASIRHARAPVSHDLDRLRVHELMTRAVASVRPDTPVPHAARIMAERGCGALPVIGDNGVLAGMVTDRDITLRVVAVGEDMRGAIVANCMTKGALACYANESLAECMRQMARHQVRRMPIVDDRGRLVGILSQGDLARRAGLYPTPEERWALTEVLSAISQPAATARR